jgi:hypothetical protein
MKKTLFTFVSLCLFLGAFTVSAEDGKVYPGTMCHSNEEALIQYAYTRAWNSSTSADLWLDCPVVKDSVAGYVTHSYAWVVDQNPNSDKNVNCTLYCLSSELSTYTGWWTPTQYSSGSNATPQKLTMGSVSCTTDYSLSMACWIPRKWNGAASGVAAYRVDES